MTRYHQLFGVSAIIFSITLCGCETLVNAQQLTIEPPPADTHIRDVRDDVFLFCIAGSL